MYFELSFILYFKFILRNYTCENSVMENVCFHPNIKPTLNLGLPLSPCLVGNAALQSSAVKRTLHIEVVVFFAP